MNVRLLLKINVKLFYRKIILYYYRTNIRKIMNL